MIIKSVEFLTSAAKKSQYPPEGVPEIAFAGRSNVGKSSLINLLMNRKKLAKVSQNPGKTRTINFFTRESSEAESAAHMAAPLPASSRLSGSARQALNSSASFFLNISILIVSAISYSS